jgi:ADP-ribose pyrophosphatase YjhB (NUDIX family)
MDERALFGLAVNVTVLDDEDRVLLTRREDFEVWCLPGGAVDPGESLAAAAVREVEEETGLRVTLSRLVGLYSRPKFGGYHTLAVFAAAVSGGTLRPEPSEVIEIGWFRADDLPADLLWGQRERIHDATNGFGGSIVRSTDRELPVGWPADRVEQYALRDRSGLSRSSFYEEFRRSLGDDESPIEVPGASPRNGD